MRLDSIEIKYFRSITNFEFKVNASGLTTFCGVNNVGKTNVLRAINLFFAADLNGFDAENDIPFHIDAGSRGAAYKTTITGKFYEGSKLIEISTIFTPSVKNRESSLQITGKSRDSSLKSFDKLSEVECIKILSNFEVFFIEANNIDLPTLISDIFVNEVLPDLDRLKGRQRRSLDDLNTFIDTTKGILSSIELDMTKNLHNFTSNVEGINLQNWNIKIVFPEFIKLRQAISQMVSLTINDANSKNLEFKGSGVQKIVLLALMRFLSQRYQNCLWLIDEPEVFLQPSLQKEVYRELKELASKIPVFITTHSQYFVDIEDLDYTHLLTAEYSEKTYSRKPGQVFVATATQISAAKGYDKIESIRSHLGLSRNDNWIVTPFNLLVEGEEDKSYLSSILRKLEIPIPNILVAAGASKIKGYLQFLQDIVETKSKPLIKCILDHDDAGRTAYTGIKPNTYNKVIVQKCFVHRSHDDGSEHHDYEFEDMLPMDLIYQATNDYLKKRGYRKIKTNALSNRYAAAYINKPILQHLTELSSSANENMNQLDFEDYGAKKFINMQVCKRIDAMTKLELETLIDANKGLKSFLENVFQGVL